MKINYLLFNTALTGGNRVILEIANQLVERGHDVTVTTLGTPFSLWWMSPKAKINFVERFVLPRKIAEKMSNRMPGKIWEYVNQCVLLKKIMNLADSAPECDINVATFCFTAFSAFRSEKGVPFYHMQHYEPIFFNDPYVKKMVEETYFLPLNKIANSIWLRDKLKELYGFSDIPIINPAVDHNIFYPREIKKNKDKFRIVSLGKPVSWKGHKELFAALEIVYQQRKDIELVLFEIKKWSCSKTSFPLIFVKSPVGKKLAELYSSCDLLVSASWYESFPLPPLEAMACGLPVVTTRLGTEDYAVDGVNSLVVPPKNPEVLVNAILRLLEDENLRRKLSEEGIKTAKQFTWDKTANKVEEIFKTTLSNAKST